FKATVFLVTDFCGKYNDWAGNPRELPRSKLLSWQEIRELSEAGVEFGSHTRTHPDLRKLPPERVKNEMVESKSEIENILGCETTAFAYPYGRHNGTSRRIAEQAFASACSTKLGKVGVGSDRFCLERVDTYYLSNKKVFDSLPSRSFDRYLKFRSVMRDMKSLIRVN
ncbi:MAG: polysaccharide deacetylase family protein, partial [Pyrinomonadaceae bacterium]